MRWRRILGLRENPFTVLRYREQRSLAFEVCPDCREPFRVAELEIRPGRVGRFLLCRCGTRYQDPTGRIEMVHARGRSR